MVLARFCKFSIACDVVGLFGLDSMSSSSEDNAPTPMSQSKFGVGMRFSLEGVDLKNVEPKSSLEGSTRYSSPLLLDASSSLIGGVGFLFASFFGDVVAD